MKNLVKKNSGKINILTIILIIVIIICIGVIVYLLFFKNTNSKEYAPGINDKNIIKIDEKSNNSSGSVNMIYSKNVKVNLKDKKININFKNPNGSNQMIVISIVANVNGEDIEIGSTDRLPSGYGINEVNLKENTDLNVGTYDGYFYINYYQNDTEEMAVINTKIPVKIEID